MRKLSEIRGENALDVLADLLEPVSEIFTDNEFINKIRGGEKMAACTLALRNHKSAVLRILAILEGVSPEEYNPSLAEIPVLLLQLLNDPDVVAVFQ